ncbi:MAG: hypothetical protein COW84_04555 [Gammaproteobacteria bacterium CG22_combo_CG10-13_8_21_14_all_40_8]|nr:MAG: hypothetical protein COW84_04555 [Gammaproteobacteria bacterium CG22_combo_CG10-13_8_21_14_all_40_8]
MKWKIFQTLLWFSILSSPVFAETLYVFVPSSTSPKVMQDNMTALCPNIDVVVFGRGADFRKQLTDSPPDAVLSLSAVIEKSTNFKSVLIGLQNGSADEKYVLAGVDKAPDIASISEKKIGVVDLLGRNPMKDYISELFSAPVKLKSVTKQEDLLPLLSFGAADAIFVPERIFNEIKSKTQLNLVSTPLDIKVGLARAGFSGGKVKENIAKCIESFNNSLNESLGVEKWKSQ